MNTEPSPEQTTRDLAKTISPRQILTLILLATINLTVSLWMGQQAYGWMPPQASSEAVLVDKLFSFMTTIGTFIFIGVIGTLLYSMIFQRAAKYDDSDGPPIEGNIKLEIIWTAIPIMLVIWIGTVSYQTYDQMSILGAIAPKAMDSSPTVPPDQKQAKKQAKKQTVLSDLSPAQTDPPIEVHSRQWSWEFRYPNQNVSSTELHLPVNRRARFKLTSDDVLHGFYVPAFRVKQDIIPGREIDFSFTPIREGRYRLRDSEYSGTYFAANQTDVIVESADRYQSWLAAAKRTTPATASNIAAEDFSRAEKETISLGWATIKPAPAPIVNYTAPEVSAAAESAPSEKGTGEKATSKKEHRTIPAKLKPYAEARLEGFSKAPYKP